MVNRNAVGRTMRYVVEVDGRAEAQTESLYEAIKAADYLNNNRAGLILVGDTGTMMLVLGWWLLDPCPICDGDHDRITRRDCPEYEDPESVAGGVRSS